MVLTKIPGSLITDASITSADITDSTITNAKMAVDPANASNLSSGDVPLAQLGNVPAVDMSSQSDDIALLAFKTQANGNLARYNLVDQSVDAFEDASGVDAIASSGEARDSAGKYYSGFEAGNYFGDESDGALSTSGNVVYTVPNKTGGGYDGDYVVKQYSSLTINAGHTISTDHIGRGLLIYVTGDCVLNGTITMDDRGAAANPATAGGSDNAAVDAAGIQLPMIGAGSDTLAAATFAGTGTAAVAAVANQPAIAGDGTIFTLARVGGAGALERVDSGGYPDGNNGSNGSGSTRTGGGGSGAVGGRGVGGAGGPGTCFSGGSGGGAAQSIANTGVWAYGTAGNAYAGAGGVGASENSAYGNPGRGAGGGAGNPGGSGAWYCNNGQTGNGGVVWLIVKGNLSGNGTITADGSNGGFHSGGGNHYQAGGGASGGGAIIVLCAGTNSYSGTAVAAGGTGGAGATQSHADGGNGGDGLTTQATVSGEGSYNQMVLVSNAITAEAAPTKADIVFTYTNGAGTAVVGTNITAEASMDNGTTWTDFGIAAGDTQGTTGGHTIVTKNNVTLTSTSGTSMRYRIKTLVQSATMDTRIHAVSLGWS